MKYRNIAAGLLLAVAGMTVSVAAHAESDCRFTQGYWQNRAQNVGDTTTIIWSELRDLAFYQSGVTYAQTLTIPPRGNPYWILAHQMVAAQANDLNGADPTGAPGDALNQAETLLSSYTPAQVAALPKSSPIRQSFIQAAGVLDAWNNGLIGTGICDGGEQPH